MKNQNKETIMERMEKIQKLTDELIKKLKELNDKDYLKLIK